MRVRNYEIRVATVSDGQERMVSKGIDLAAGTAGSPLRTGHRPGWSPPGESG